MTAHYISLDGYRVLDAELTRLLTVERPRVVDNVAAAAAEGDRSENAEYIYGKKRLREIDKRIEFLTRRLDDITVVERAATDDRVVFLSWVTVEDSKGDEHLYRLVGADETSAERGLISFRSPVGRALLGKRLDDEVSIRTPGGIRELVIVGISIQQPASKC